MSDNNFLKFTSVGQARIRYDLRRYNNEDFLAIKNLITESDISMTNLEVSISDGNGGWPLKNPLSYPGAPPVVLDVLKWMGFNLLSLANNHSWDLGPLGILNTIEHTKQRGFAYAGTGTSLEDAAAPCYMETEKGRIALIAMASGALPVSSYATSRNLFNNRPGGINKIRPGLNPLHVDTHHAVLKKDIDSLKEISKNLRQEEMKESSRVMHGWGKEEELLDFFGLKFVEGNSYENKKIISDKDLTRNINNIKLASEHSDYVFVYLHQHHWDPNWQKTPKWAQNVAHKFIDAGATAVIGHGVPMLHGIEIYKKRPIVYSLGNFIFHTLNIWKRQEVWESVVSVASFDQGELKFMKLYPIALGGEEAIKSDDFKHRIAPHMVRGQYANSILQRIAALSQDFGTEVSIKNGIAKIDVN